MKQGIIVGEYKNKKYTIVYAMAQTKDKVAVYFFTKVTKETDLNIWLKSIYKLSEKKYSTEIDQKKFLDQFTVYDEYNKTTYIHKKDSSVKFVISNNWKLGILIIPSFSYLIF